MSFELTEISQHDGEPIECYHFTYLGQDFAYTSGTVPVTIRLLDGRSLDFAPVFIKRGKFGNTDDIAKISVEVTLAYSNPVYRFFLQWMEGYVFLDIYKSHFGAANAHPYWRGRILSAKLKNNEAILVGESSFTTMKKPGLQRIFQRACNHILFDVFCRVTRASYLVNGTIDAVTGNVLTIGVAAGFPTAYFRSGYLMVGHEHRMIMTHTTNQITINSALTTLPEIGTAVILYPGCDKLFLTCRGRFNNELNFGGFPHIPIKNPFRHPLV